LVVKKIGYEFENFCSVCKFFDEVFFRYRKGNNTAMLKYYSVKII